MRYLFAILLFAPFVSQSQTTVDTTIDGYNAVIFRPAQYYVTGNADSAIQCIVFSYGSGETGASYATMKSIGGPIAYISSGGFNGKVLMPAGDTLFPIVIGLRIPVAFPTSGQPLAKLNAIRAAFKIKKKNLHVGGFSAGGYAYKIMATEDNEDTSPPYGPFTYADAFKTIVDIQGVIPDDNANWTTKVKNFANNNNGGGKYWGFWGTGDGERGIETFRDEMNAAVSGSGTVHTTADGHSYTAVHRVWGNPSGTAPQTWTIGGRTLTAWQWTLLQGEDTIQAAGGGGIDPIVDVRDDTTMLFLADTVTLTGSASDVDGTIVSHVWTKKSGPTAVFVDANSYTTKVALTGGRGTYVFTLTATDDDDSTASLDVTVHNGIPCNQATGVRYVLAPSGGDIYITNGYAQPWRGGDTLDIPSGTYGVIEIDSFGGDPCRPIYIRNTGGQVNVTTAIRFKKDVHYVEVIGNGHAGTTYGFKTKTWGSDRVSWFTARRWEIGPNASGVGIFLKQDPVDTLNPSHQYGAYINRKIWIDSMYVHNIGGEGMYIGHTGPGGNEETYGRIPQRGDSITISNCIVDSTDWDGIQLSNARDGCLIYNNRVTNFGLIDMGSQRAGIISGGNTNAKIYNNHVESGRGNGIQMFGYGLIEVYNNTIKDAGLTTSHVNGEESMFSNAYLNTVETNPEQTLLIYNNYFVNPKARGAIRCSNDGGVLDTVIIQSNRFCFPSPPTEPWKNSYIFVPTGYTDTNNTLSCNSTGGGRMPPRKRVQ